MSRSNVSLAGAAGSPASTAPPTARLFVIGRSQTGDGTVQRVTGNLSAYRPLFGDRAGYADLNDVLQTFFKAGGGEAYVVRALGAAPVKATISLSTGKIVVTAKDPGAFANGWTAAWNNATHVLTVTDGSFTESYTGTTAVELLTAAAASARFTVTSDGSLPSSDVTATALAGGTDDYATVDWAALLALFPAELGAGVVAVAGEPYTVVGSALALHASTSRREAMVSLVAGADVAAALAAVSAVTNYDAGADKTQVCWPHVQFTDTGVTITADPVGYFAGVRAKAHQNVGPWASPLRARSISRFLTGVDVSPTDAQIDALIAGHVTFAYPRSGLVQVDGWETAAPTLGVDTLHGAQYASVIDAVAQGAQLVGDSFIGQLVNQRTLGDFEGALIGLLAPYVAGGALYTGYGVDGEEVDPGYILDLGPDVNTPQTMAAGQVNARIALRLTATTEFVNTFITAGDASTTF